MLSEKGKVVKVAVACDYLIHFKHSSTVRYSVPSMVPYTIN